MSGIATAAIGVGELAYGIIKEESANKKAKALAASRPVATLNPEIASNLSIAESEFSNANDQVDRSYNEATDSQLAASIGASLKGGGTPNDVASIFSADATGRYNLMQFKEELRRSRLTNLSNALDQEAADKNRVFDFNSRKWFDDAQANAAKQQQAGNLIGTGVSTLGSAAGGFLTNKQMQTQNADALSKQTKMYDDFEKSQQQLMNEYFGVGTSQPAASNNIDNGFAIMEN